MKVADYRSAIVEFIRAQANPADKFSHQPRLYQLANLVGEGLSFDDDVLFAAAWMHDLGVFIGHRPEDPQALAQWDCVAYALAQTPAILERLGFPADKIAAVLETIGAHQPSAEPTNLEGVILRDADILEQLGAVGILRTVSKVGRDTRYPVFADALRVLQANVESLPGRLRLPKARELAEPRVRLLKAFLDAAQAEAGDAPL